MPDINDRIDLYELVPAFYRIDDSFNGYPLKKLLALLSDQANLVKESTAGLWDDFFVETAADWVIPYLGELIGNRALHEGVRGRRADVARTIYYRRRKGTLPMLEELARDVTGWGAHAVAFFEQLGWTQNMNHLRYQSARNPNRRNPNATDRVGTAHIRNYDAMDLIDGPFDYTTHTIDVRRIRRTQGWHNIRNIGFFLWRLFAYPSVHSLPRQSAAHPHGYHFSPLGNPAPLFTRAQPERSENGLAGEIHVPAPIRPLAFHNDRGAYYGDSLSFAIYNQAVPIELSEIICADLSQWERPPAGVSGVWSANLGAVPVLGPAPELSAAIAGEGPFTVSITLPFATLAQAAASLEAAIRAAHHSRAFEGVRVISVGTRLLVLPGVRGASLSFASTVLDAVTATQLGLNATTDFRGLMSGDLGEFDGLTHSAPQVRIDIGGGTHTAPLAPLPINDVATARARLQAAINSGPGLTYTGAQVLDIGSRLLVIPGVDNDPVLVFGTNLDATTVEELRLASKAGIDVARGRLAFAIGAEPPQANLSVRYHYGFSYEIGGGPYERRRRSADPDTGHADTLSIPNALTNLLRVPSPNTSLVTALAAWTALGSPNAVIQVDNSETYSGNLTINLPTNNQELVIQAINSQRPTIIGNITVNAASQGARLRIDGFWVEGQIHVTSTPTSSLGTLEIAHCRLVPGIRMDEEGGAVSPGVPSLLIDAGNTGLTVLLDHAITGPVVIPPQCAAVKISDSIVDSPGRAAPAVFAPALISDDLSAFAGSGAGQILVTVGDVGPVVVPLPALPNLAAIETNLRAALQAASPSPAFATSDVVTQGSRIVILAPRGGAIAVQPSTSSPSLAAQLGLLPAGSRSTVGTLSGPIPAAFNLDAAPPRLSATWGDDPAPLTFIAGAKTFAGFRGELETALNGAYPGATAAVYGADRYLVFPPGESDAISFAADPADSRTIALLQLAASVPAIAGSIGGEHPAPPATLQRVTILGHSHFRELTLASEVMFYRRVIADRRQSGCVRFSYVATESRTPQRYRCQPNLALENQSDPAAIALILLRLIPVFTSLRLADPGFAQLALSCASEIRTGAQDGSEIGAFSKLKQPQREANLRLRLEEYLPLGLEPGLIFIS